MSNPLTSPRLPRLTVLDDETIEWLLTPAPGSSAAKQWLKKLAETKKKQAWSSLV